MQIRTDDLRTFLSSQGYYRLMDYPVLDVPFQHSTWTNGTYDVDFEEDTEFTDLLLLTEAWSHLRGGATLAQQLVSWARENGLLGA